MTEEDDERNALTQLLGVTNHQATPKRISSIVDGCRFRSVKLRISVLIKVVVHKHKMVLKSNALYLHPDKWKSPTGRAYATRAFASVRFVKQLEHDTEKKLREQKCRRWTRFLSPASSYGLL